VRDTLGLIEMFDVPRSVQLGQTVTAHFNDAATVTEFVSKSD
jgi:hypothetical protein